MRRSGGYVRLTTTQQMKNQTSQYGGYLIFAVLAEAGKEVKDEGLYCGGGLLPICVVGGVSGWINSMIQILSKCGIYFARRLWQTAPFAANSYMGFRKFKRPRVYEIYLDDFEWVEERRQSASRETCILQKKSMRGSWILS